LTQLSFEFDQTGKIVDSIGQIIRQLPLARFETRCWASVASGARGLIRKQAPMPARR
jgi:hypothetical protein